MIDECSMFFYFSYLAEGCSMQELAWCYRVGKSIAHYVIKETTSVLWEKLCPLVLPEPTREQFEEISMQFYERWDMPNCFGAVDGKHVSIQAPKHSGSDYFNYKKGFSLVLLAVCDAKYCFTMVDIGAQGSSHDSTVFKESKFGKAILNGSLDIPLPKNLPNTNMMVNHFVVADQAFPLHSSIMRPYPGKNLSIEKLIFNYRLSRARRTIENTFGILAQKWRIYRKPIIASIDMCESIVNATVVLHNFLRMQEINHTQFSSFSSSMCNHPERMSSMLRSVCRLGSNNCRRIDRQQRDILAQYFMSNGSIPAQWNHIYVGSVPNNLT